MARRRRVKATRLRSMRARSRERTPDPVVLPSTRSYPVPSPQPVEREPLSERWVKHDDDDLLGDRELRPGYLTRNVRALRDERRLMRLCGFARIERSWKRSRATQWKARSA